MCDPTRPPAMELSRAFRALGHPHRLALVRSLMARALACCPSERADDCSLDPASCAVGTLAEVVPCAPSTLSHHLKELAAAGLIERVRDGRQLLCRVSEACLEELRTFLSPVASPGESPSDPPDRRVA